MSGATEALLDELITINREQAAFLRDIAARSGGGGGPNGGAAAGSFGAATLAGRAVASTFSTMGTVVNVAAGIVGGTFSVAMGLAAKGFQGLTQAGNTLWQNQMRLAEGAIEGTNSLSSLTAGLENLPFGLGLVAQAMTYQTKVLEKNISTYQQLATTGATLGGNLDTVRRSAAGMYLSMDEFSKVMQNSVTQLRFLGGSTDEGAKNLIKFNTGLIQGNVGKQLLGMGYTLEEVNGMLGSYSESIGGLKADQLKDQRQMEQSVKFFAEELDLAAQLEGKTRKQKEEEMKQAAAQAAVRAKLAEMGPEEQKKYLAAYNAALRIGGKGAAEALQSQLLGLPPMTKAAQMFTAVNGEAANTVRQLGNTVTDGTTALQSRARSDRLAAEGAVQSGNRYKELGMAATALTFQQGEAGAAISGMANTYADNMNQGIRTADDAERRIQQTRDGQIAAQESQIGATVQAQGAMKHFGGLMEMLSEALAPLFPVVTALIQGFMEILPKVISFGGDLITKIIIPLFQDLFGGLTIDDVLGPFKDFFKGLFGSGEGATTMESVRKGLSDFLKPITTFIGDIVKAINWEAVGAVFRTTFQTIGRVIQGIANIIGTIFGGDGGNFGKGLQDAFERLGSIVNRIVEIVENIIQGLSATPIFENMKTFFLKLFDIAFTIVEVILNIIESPLGKFVIAVLGTVVNMMFEVFNAALDAVMGVVKVVEGIFDILSGDFSEGLDKIFGGLGDIIGGVVDWVGSILSGILSILGNALSYILFLVVELGKEIIDWFSNLGTMISNLLSAAWEGIVSAVTGMVNAVVNGFVAIKDGIVNFFSGGYETFLTDIWESIKSIFSMVVDGIKNIAGNVWDKITSWGSDEEEATETTPRPAPAQPRQPASREPPRPPAREPAASPSATPATSASPTSAAAPTIGAAGRAAGAAGPGGAAADSATLNNNLQLMVRNLREISDNTKRTADLLASNGNLFRR
jgi:phage-related protein